MVDIGRFNTLTILKKVNHGIYVDAKDLGEILVPKRDVPEDCSVGDQIDVFLYSDSEDCFIATTQQPYAEVGEFAYLRCVQTTPIGAFMDWGLAKDLLVPFAEQKRPFQEDDFYLVYVMVDPRTERIVASTKLSRYLDQKQLDVQRGDSVELIICDQTQLGYTALINRTGLGMIHMGDVFTEIEIGQECVGYIKKIRDDGKIDLSLQEPGYGKIKGVAADILSKLETEGGELYVSDKSPPETVYEHFGISKKAFKKALGRLYKHRLIIIGDYGIRLTAKGKSQKD